ncbi:MAG: hypothetical protein J2P48_00625 [Alphaproteobacteria bacterium]|nr:hypothetical protein [Alphaproteobacteria bacterium]
MRNAVPVLALILLGACADESGLPSLPNDRAVARFMPGGVVNAIEVQAIDRLPLRRAELIAPDGQATAASYLDVNRAPTATYYQRFPNGPDAGNALAARNVAPGAPKPADIGGAPQGSVQLLAIVSNATIPLPDEIAYRRDWRSYRIVLGFGDRQQDVERRVLPAPEPPPKG